jgi:hypothetical protein
LTAGEVAGQGAQADYYPFSVNPYWYANANPVQFIDRLGLVSSDPSCALQYFVTGAVAGAIGGAAGGCLFGGALATPGGGTIPAGCLLGASGGAASGAKSGAIGGAVYGVINCLCEEEEEQGIRPEFCGN